MIKESNDKMVSLRSPQIQQSLFQELVPALKKAIEADQASLCHFIVQDTLASRQESYDEEWSELESSLIDLFYFAADVGSIDCMKYLDTLCELCEQDYSFALIRCCEVGIRYLKNKVTSPPEQVVVYYNSRRIYSPVVGVRKKINQESMVDWLLLQGADPNYIEDNLGRLHVDPSEVQPSPYRSCIQALMWYQNTKLLQYLYSCGEDVILDEEDIDFLILMACHPEQFENMEDLFICCSIMITQPIVYYTLIELSKHVLVDYIKIVYSVLDSKYASPRLWSHLVQYSRSFTLRQWISDITNAKHDEITKWILTYPLDRSIRVKRKNQI